MSIDMFANLAIKFVSKMSYTRVTVFDLALPQDSNSAILQKVAPLHTSHCHHVLKH